MELMFNMDDGYFEGLVRGFRAGILKQGDYMNLCQCETLDGSIVSLRLF
jgi:V-type H+-transporting ATPase subunit d